LSVLPAIAQAADPPPATEEDDGTSDSSGYPLFGGAFGAGMIILGAAYGISKIGSCAVESMARQPEVAANIQTAMIIAAALLEGVTFFALVVAWFS